MNDVYKFNVFQGYPLHTVSARHVARTFASDPSEYARIALSLSPGSLIWQVERCTRTSIYLVAWYPKGFSVRHRIKVDDSPIYVLHPGIVHYN